MILFISSLFLCSCLSKEEKAAEKWLQDTQQLLSRQEYDLALALIDSLHLKYPTLVKIRKEALLLEKEIKLKKSTSDSAKVAPLLVKMKMELDSLIPLFYKDTIPDMPEETILRYKNHDPIKKDPSLPFLDAYLEQNGRLQVIAGCSGSATRNIEYIEVEEQASQTKVNSDTILYDGGRNYRYTDLGITYERLTISTSAGERIASLIANTLPKAKIKVTFYLKGNKPSISFYLPESSKKAISVSYHMYRTYVDIRTIEDILDKHKRRKEMYSRQ